MRLCLALFSVFNTYTIPIRKLGEPQNINMICKKKEMAHDREEKITLLTTKEQYSCLRDRLSSLS
jgi:hypothetical protein